MRCPNPDCPYARKRGRAAEFRSGITVCSDCGAALVEAEAAPASAFAPGGARRAVLPWPSHVVAALAVTVAAACAALALQFVSLPYVERESIAALYGSESSSAWRLTQLSAGAIGVAPWLAGALVVEIVAFFVPALRARRHVPKLRGFIDRAAVVVGAFFAVVHAWMVTSWIANIRGAFFDSVAPELWSLGPKLLVVGTLVGATCLVRLLASAIDRHGTGNGLVLVTVLPLVLDVALALERTVQIVQDDVLTPFEIVLTFALFAAPVVVAWRFVHATPGTASWGSFAARPSAGIVPATVVLGVPSLFAMATLFLDVNPPAPDDKIVLVVTALLAAALVPVCASVWASPARAARLRAASEGRGVTRADEDDARIESAEALTHAWIVNGVLVGGFIAAALWLPYGVVHAASLCVLVAVVRDLVAEVSARRAHATPLLSIVGLHRFDLVPPLMDALTRANIPASLRGAHVRVLSHFFAPWIPIEILVRPSDGEAARKLVDDVIARCTSIDAAHP